MIKLLIILMLLPLVIADISKEEFVKKINEIRLELAKKGKIPNMHEMVWDDEIVSRIGEIDKNSEEYKKLFSIKSYENEIQFLNEQLPYIKRSWEYQNFEFLAPAQTHFGCVVDGEKLKCQLKPGVGIFEKKGEPGSDCNEGFENNGGLCRRVEEGITTTVKTSPEISEFVQKVNEFRLEWAKRANVPNMNEMSWSAEIVSRSGEIDENSEEYWQLIFISSYEEQIQLFNEYLSSTMAFEFLNPTQTHFGCALIDERWRCLLKPRFGMFAKKGEPGSDCKEGFENHGGLCGRIITTTGIPTLTPPTTSSTLKPIPDENKKKEEKTENNSSSSNLFVIFVLTLWICGLKNDM